ncbi:hypothetical protein LOTGIDRAFT_235748 [Lottia gigantea]|uniref:Ketimine reductase mu-crystallin n=1 Tax=Lottia gigantea TaxID=225164 RepID=V3Z507_LOTGI|nr:hypothetical protein LOTGIDRAFT_235748 [Lottia gigantea]ESO85788.1 hypothetical protein LOTGIDRAFT_235748 [Lottia gigantea]
MKQVTSDEISKVLKYGELIPQMESALRKISSASDYGIDQPVRSVVRIKPQEAALGIMPVYCQDDEILVTKLISYFPNNKIHPSHHALIIAFNSQNGVPIAILDADVLTEMRTAAASAVASKYLAKPDSKIMAIIGSGVQAKSHYYALSEIFQFTEVRVYSRNTQTAERLCKEIKGVLCTSVKEAVKDADIITTVTSSTKPILQQDWIKPGVHINAVGACLPDSQEISSEIMQSAVVYVDNREAALKESGDVILGKAEIYAEIGEVIAGSKESKTSETTVFKSLGLAIEDAVSVKLILEKLT